MKIKIRRYCSITGMVNSMQIDSTPDLEERIEAWDNLPAKEKPLIQNAFGDLQAHEREFILSGLTNELWDDIYSNLSDE